MKDLLLEMSDDVLITLLDPAIDEVLLRESLQNKADCGKVRGCPQFHRT